MRRAMGLFCVVLGGLLASGCGRDLLHRQRSSAQDLAISGALHGLPRGEKRYVRYEDLERLHQVTLTVRDDENFSRPVKLSGVPLDELAAALDASGKQLIAALCTDGYEGHYTAEYRAAHHPFLVLRIGGKEPAQWPRQQDGSGYGPYLISHSSFTPAFHVRAHQDAAQIPTNVTELRFYDQDAALARLKPAGGGAAARDGYEIALQNCLRCHRAGEIGGTKAPYDFAHLSALARATPEFFGRYVRSPASVNPKTEMPGNPNYDGPTLEAVTAYFQHSGVGTAVR